MQITSILAAFLLSTAVSAKGHNNSKGNGTSTDITTASVKKQCSALNEMTKLVDIVNNATLLAEFSKNNTAKAAALQSKAANLTSELQPLTSNTTLLGECAVISAHQDAIKSCEQMAAIEKIQAIAANDTKLQDKFDGNATKIAAYKAKASDLAAKLTTSQANSTLTTFCSTENDKQTCQSIAKIQKEISKSSNTTWLNQKFDGNETKIAKEQAKATKLQTKLDALTGNSTLMDTCATLNISTAAATSSNGTTSTDDKSPAVRLDAPTHLATTALLVLLGSMMAML
ncbi:hypothetical protein F5Y03DRAFT_334246 [Xylaria venustula]|nr:hypothetical protein F5Y03DRAFT_334246 [Xylaria venustula]